MALRYFAMEAIRMKRTALPLFPLAGLVMALIFVLLSQGAQSAGAASSDGALMWEALYFTGIAGPLMFTLGALPEVREKNARNGGLQNRGSNRHLDRLARVLWLFVISFFFQACNFGLLACFGTFRPTAFWVAWIGSLMMIALGNALARNTGIVVALLVGIVWQALGTALAEHPRWYAIPPAWPTRVLLNPIGVNVNATPITQSNPAFGESPALGLTLCAVGVLVSLLLVGWEVTPKRRDKASTSNVEEAVSAPPAYRKKTPFPLRSAIAAAGSWPTYVCLVLSVLIVLALPSDIYTYFVLPIGAGLLPILTWPLVAGAFAQMCQENSSWSRAYIAAHVAVVVILSVLAALSGGSLVQCVLWILTGTTLLFVSFLLLIRFGVGASLAAMILWTIIALTIGGDVLAETQLWVIPFSAWGAIVPGTPREPIALVVSLVLVAVSSILLAKAIKRAKR